VDTCPSVTKSEVRFGSWDGIFYALDFQGKLRWKFKTAGPIVSSAAVVENSAIYFGSHDSRLYALNDEGVQKWSYKTGGPILSSPALAKDLSVIFTSVDGFLYSVSSDGHLNWKLKTGGITESSPVIAENGTIYVGVNHELWMVSADGKKLWSQWNEGEVETAPLCLADSSVCYVTKWGSVVNYNPTTVQWWRYFLGTYGYASPAIGTNGALYFQGGTKWGSICALGPVTNLAASSWPKFHANPRNTGVQPAP
jgi:outer membrane protein assembly factor BamB